MSRGTALVTGAAGFVGRTLVRALADAHWHVRAGVHHERDRAVFAGHANVEAVAIDLHDSGSLVPALQGVEQVYHCAALLDAQAGRERLMDVNAASTRRLWEAASASGVRKALYCSSTAVYGLLSRSGNAITEQVQARAIEPYGYSKLQGEMAALEIAARTTLHTTIIRPVAIFGLHEKTAFGRSLRDAAMSKLLIARGFEKKKFSFVHVEDVAAAAVHVLGLDCACGEVYNVAVDEPIPFEKAFRVYQSALRDAGRSYAKVRLLAAVSRLLHDRPLVLRRISALLGERFMFGIWHPGFDLTYSSRKILGTGFKFNWDGFERVLASCIERESGEGQR
jgi:UDP-glucuronate 4-epimerase